MGVEQTVSRMLWVDMLPISCYHKKQPIYKVCCPKPHCLLATFKSRTCVQHELCSARTLCSGLQKKTGFETLRASFVHISNQACHCMENISRHLSVNKLWMQLSYLGDHIILTQIQNTIPPWLELKICSICLKYFQLTSRSCKTHNPLAMLPYFWTI